MSFCFSCSVSEGPDRFQKLSFFLQASLKIFVTILPCPDNVVLHLFFFILVIFLLEGIDKKPLFLAQLHFVTLQTFLSQCAHCCNALSSSTSFIALQTQLSQKMSDTYIYIWQQCCDIGTHFMSAQPQYLYQHVILVSLLIFPLKCFFSMKYNNNIYIYFFILYIRSQLRAVWLLL